MGWQEALAQIDPLALDAPLRAMRLPKKTEILESEGLTTVAAVVESLRTGMLLRLPSVGLTTTREIEKRLGFLPHAIDPISGRISWQNYALACGFELVPSHDVASGSEFLSVFPAVIDGIIRFHESPVDRLILTERLVRQPGERKTLDEIANAAPETITRERVRQRQERLLRGLSNALLHDDYREVPFHFRDSFAAPWKEAAHVFAGRSEISFGEFVSGIEEAWDVSSVELFPHLPLITSILTSKAQIPFQLRQGMKLNPRLYGTISANLARAPVTWLAAGKVLEELSAREIGTIGDLVEAAREGCLPAPHSTCGKRCAELLAAISGALNEHGAVDWRLYGEALGLPLLPMEETPSPEQFLRNLNADLEVIVRVNATSMRAADIFRLRTSLPQASRRTLAEVANMLGSHGPSVKREETVMLDALHAQLVLGDFSHSRVIYRPAFLRWWREAWQVYESSRSSYVNFCNAIAQRWQLPMALVCANAEALWAVFARYPNGRREAVRARRRSATSQAYDGGMIVLRGFRRAH